MEAETKWSEDIHPISTEWNIYTTRRIRESNPESLALKPRILPLDQCAVIYYCFIFKQNIYAHKLSSYRDAYYSKFDSTIGWMLLENCYVVDFRNPYIDIIYSQIETNE